MRLAIEENRRVFSAKAQLFHTRANLRRRRNQIRIDQHISLRGDHKVTGKVPAAHVIKIVGNSERREGRGPIGIYFPAE